MFTTRAVVKLVVAALAVLFSARSSSSGSTATTTAAASDSVQQQQQQQQNDNVLHCELVSAGATATSTGDDDEDDSSVISCRFTLKNAVKTALENKHRDLKFCFDLDDVGLDDDDSGDDDDSDGDDSDDDDDDDDLRNQQFCIEAKVTPTVTGKRSSSSSSSSTNDESASSSSSSQSSSTTSDPSTAQTTTEKKPANANDATKTRMVRYDPRTGAITVGEIRYEHPYTKYGYDVSLSLMERVHENRNRLEFGTWLYSLGLAHSARGADLNDGGDITGTTGDEYKMALNAFQLARQVFEGINDEWAETEEFDAMTDFAKYQLACVYFQMSEAHTLMGGKTNGANNSSLEYMRKAEEMYRSMLEEHLDRHDGAFAKRVRGYAQSQDQAEKTWATSLMRLGILTLDQVDTSAMQIDAASLRALMESKGVEGSSSELKKIIESEDNDAEATRVFGTELATYLRKILKAEAYFDDAGKIYGRGLERDNLTEKRLIELKYDLAITYQNKVTATTVRADLAAIIYNAEQSIAYYKDVLDGRKKKQNASNDDDDNDDGDGDDIVDQMANLYYLLSDSYLQLGMYDEASHSFERSMKMHEKYDLMPPEDNIAAATASSAGGDGEVSADDLTAETIASYEKVLEDYQSKVRDDPNLLDDLASGEGVVLDSTGSAATYYYDRSDAYEGDLQAALGAIYLDKGDRVQAEMYLSRAVILYERSIASGGGGGGGDDGDARDSIDNEKETRNALADTKYNLAILRSRNSQFMEAAKFFREALDIYKVTVGEGENPVKRRLSDLSYRISSAQSAKLKPVGGSGGTNNNEDEQEEGKASDGGEDRADLSDYWKDFKLALENGTMIGDEL